MKLSVFVVFCVFLTIQNKSVSCGLVKNLLDKGHETIENVRDDFKNILHLNKNKEENTAVIKEKTTKKNEPLEAVTSSTTIEPTATEPKPTETKNGEKIEEATATSKSSTAAEAVITSTTSPAKDTTEPQEGRENFKTECAAGYKRTADGRCKPTY